MFDVTSKKENMYVQNIHTYGNDRSMLPNLMANNKKLKVDEDYKDVYRLRTRYMKGLEHTESL